MPGPAEFVRCAPMARKIRGPNLRNAGSGLQRPFRDELQGNRLQRTRTERRRALKVPGPDQANIVTEAGFSRASRSCLSRSAMRNANSIA